ncbi:MAG: CRISPR-associated helicase Cas3', partial [Armatimonadota bacterium]
MIASHVFEKVCGINQPHPHQEETLDACFYRADFPLLLSAPCGTGKTEAAVAPFLAQFLEGDFRIAPRLIYVLPTRALCNQLGQRLRCYAKRMDPLIRVEVHHGGHLEDAFFMADIVVTTLDQFVYGYARTTSLVGGHLEAPAGSIANSVVVLDEAHMYQSPYTFSIVRAMLGILNAARVPVVIMTATMPPSLLKDFEEEFTRTGEPLAKVEGTDVRQRSLHVTPEPAALVTDGGLHPLAMERLRSATRALVVLNQVKRAQAAFRALREAGIEATLVHARFTAADRRRLESRIAAALGRNDRAGGVVVSTQVCEAGLDISADLLLTELAPADSLVQRMGRCARWEGEGKG